MRRLGNLLLLLGIAAAVAGSFVYLGLDLAGLFGADSLGQMGSYAARFLDPDFSASHLQATAPVSYTHLTLPTIYSV